MTKREVVWLLIRLAGVYFAYLALITLFSLLGAAWDLAFTAPKLNTADNSNTSISAPMIQPAPYPGMNPGANPGNTNQTAPEKPETPEEKAKRIAVMSFLWLVLLTGIYSALGWYFLRDGKALFALLMREELIKSTPSEPEVTTLNL